MFKTPILLLIFNRPEPTARVFEKIREMKPQYLFIAADGPRPDRKSDEDNCNKAREIVKLIDWDCQLKVLFREENLGCGIGPSNAITWFFKNVESGIILEDDCIPEKSFFYYCETLLHLYKDVDKIMHIAGNNPLYKTNYGNASYYFSKYPLVWGWATWRRAWNRYNFNIPDLQSFDAEQRLSQIGCTPDEKTYLARHYNEVYGGRRKDIWDFQWNFTLIYNNGIAITPNINLISNIGFGEDATHTFNSLAKEAYLDTGKLNKIVHPKKIIICHKADTLLYKKVWAPKTTFLNKCRNILYKIIPKNMLAFYREFKNTAIKN